MKLGLVAWVYLLCLIFYLWSCLTIICVLLCSYSPIPLWRTSVPDPLKWVLSHTCSWICPGKAVAHARSRENGRKQPVNQKHVEDGNRNSHKLSIFEENVSSRGKKGNQVEDKPVLCYFSPYSKDEPTAHFEGPIPMLGKLRVVWKQWDVDTWGWSQK